MNKPLNKNQSSVIMFDEEFFFNKEAIFDLGLPYEDAEAIYEYLLNKNRDFHGPNGYVFIDATLKVKFDRSNFMKNKLWFDKPFSYERLSNLLRALFLRLFGDYLPAEFKFTGFFEIDREIDFGRMYFSPFRASSHSYIEGIKMLPTFKCFISKETLEYEQETCVRLPKKLGNAGQSVIERVYKELFFSDADLSSAIQVQLGEYDFSKLSFSNPTVYQDGFKTLDEENLAPEQQEIQQALPIENDSSENKSGKQGKESSGSLTDATIIAALTHALEMENQEKFTGNDKIVFNHLADLFPEQKRFLAANTIKKRLGPGRDELGIPKKEKFEKQ
jgi:hypothetical protein